jgi:hypothetical protein
MQIFPTYIGPKQGRASELFNNRLPDDFLDTLNPFIFDPEYFPFEGFSYLAQLLFQIAHVIPE